MRYYRFMGIMVLLHMWATGYAALRIANYNTAGAARTGINTVLEAIGDENRNGIARPIDILLLQEQDSVSTTTHQIVNILNGIYGAGTYDRGDVNGNTTGAGRPTIVYNTSTVELLEEIMVNFPDDEGASRSTLRYQLRPVGYTSPDAIFYIYNSHYKAASDSADRRAVEASEIRLNADALGEGVHIIYAGDLNLYSSSEQAWQNLTAPGNGQAYDPVNRVGNWNNNSSFTDVHTQSPVTYEHYAGQIYGGMDDRFDFQLITNEFKDNEGLSYISNSYHTFANNNTHGLNNDISDGTGASSTVLNALEDVSDHLPVVADYQVPAKLKVTFSAVPEEVIIDEAVSIAVTVENDADTVVVAGADELDYTIFCNGDVAGNASGVDLPLNGGQVHYVSFDTATSGLKTGMITVASTSQGAEILPGNVLMIEYEVIDSGQTEYHTLGWEEYAYRYDPNAVWGKSGTMDYSVCMTDAYTGRNSLRMNPLEPNAAVFPAVIYELDDADVVNLTAFIKNVSETAGLVDIGAFYLSDHTDITSIVGQANFAAIDSTNQWESVTHTVNYDDGAGLYNGLLLSIQPRHEMLIDQLTLSFTTRGKIRLPYPGSVTCEVFSGVDFNQDCFVNLLDFEKYAEKWLDGVPGGVIPGSLETVMITGILDGTLAYDTPSAIELYVDGTQDLSQYAIQRLLNGGNWESPVALSGVYSNTYVYLIGSDSDGEDSFDAIFSTDGVYANRPLVSSYIACNGNDAFRIVKDSVVIDQVYYDTTSTGYRDSFMYRLNATGPDGGWQAGNWTIPGNNTLDYLSAQQIRAAVPFGTFSYNPDCTSALDLDVSGDCQVNLADVIIFLDEWMGCTLQPQWACW